MSVGFTVNKGSLDQRSGSLANNIMQWSAQALDLQNHLNTLLEADLEAMGYTPEDVALLKSASNDMAKLAAVFYGQVEQTPAYDFRTFVGRIAGL